MAALTPRLLTIEDVPACLELCAEAGWNQTRRDWLRLFALEPEGCLALEAEGRLAATTTIISYGRALGWIGMVLVRGACRGRGFARRLLEESLLYAAAREIRCLGLDATELGEPVYRKLGFEPAGIVERWRREPGPAIPLVAAGTYRFDRHADGEAFGADRSSLLWMLERENCAASLPDGAYALGRAGARAPLFGPCVAANPDSGGRLLSWFLGRHLDEPVFWDRFAENAAREPAYGFQCARRLTRMYKGTPPPSRPEHQFALAGFELG